MGSKVKKIIVVTAVIIAVLALILVILADIGEKAITEKQRDAALRPRREFIDKCVAELTRFNQATREQAIHSCDCRFDKLKAYYAIAGNDFEKDKYDLRKLSKLQDSLFRECNAEILDSIAKANPGLVSPVDTVNTK
jgi:hypothetical protein